MAQLKDFQVGSAGDPVTVGGVLTVQAGSASTPALTTAGDTNTGMFFPAADTIAFAEGGVEAMRLDASGNLGLGVTPSAWAGSFKALQFGSGGALYSNTTGAANMVSNAFYDGSSFKYVNTNAATWYEQNGGVGKHAWHTAASGTAGNAITFTQAMTLNASGQLLVNTTASPNSSTVKAAINGASGSDAYYQFTNGSGGGGSIGSNSGAGINFYTLTGAVGSESPTYVGKFDASGNLLVGTTSGSARVTAQGTGTSDIYFAKDSSGNSQFSVTYNGSIYARDTTVRSISDARLKENIVDSDYGLNVITALRPVRYDWKEGYGNPDQLGFIAQEVEQIFPRMIGEWKIKENEDAYKTIGPGDLIPVLVKAIQEQQAIIESLKARLDAANL
jgi:hypothetical protein